MQTPNAPLSIVCGRPVAAPITFTASLRAIKATMVHGRRVGVGEVISDLSPELARDLLSGGRFEPDDDVTASRVRAFAVTEWKLTDEARDWASRVTARLLLAAGGARR